MFTQMQLNKTRSLIIQFHLPRSLLKDLFSLLNVFALERKRKREDPEE